jgi:hypothetical protein
MTQRGEKQHFLPCEGVGGPNLDDCKESLALCILYDGGLRIKIAIFDHKTGFFYMLNFSFLVRNWIRCRIDLKFRIRIRIETMADSQYRIIAKLIILLGLLLALGTTQTPSASSPLSETDI